jgi:hypothetical protein
MVEGSTSRFSINCKLIHETEKAWLVTDGKTQDWIPKSCGEIYPCADKTWDLFAEEWLLKKKGFI